MRKPMWNLTNFQFPKLLQIWTFMRSLKIYEKFENLWEIWKIMRNLKIYEKFENL